MSDSSDSTVELEVQSFWLRYRFLILGVLGALVIASLLMAGWIFYRQQRDTAAARALATAKSPADLQKVVDQYGDTPSAASSLLLLAEAQRKDKKFAEGNTTLQTFANKFPKSQMVSTAKMAIANNLQSLGKTDEALAMFQQVASAYANDFNAPFALLAQARLLEEKKQIEEARRVCETVIAQYRDAEYPMLEAQSMLASLKPATPANSPSPVKPIPGASPAMTPAASLSPAKKP